MARARTQKRQPWMKWYPADWRADPALRMCSFAARGLWADLLSLMHEAEPYGHLVVAGRAPTVKQLAVLLGGTPREVEVLLAELEEAGVFSRTNGGLVYSRRMVRDKAKAEVDRENGSRGGNPQLNQKDGTRITGGLTPQDNPSPDGGDKAHMLEARSTSGSTVPSEPSNQRRPAATPDLSDPSVQLYARGKAVLGKGAGGLIKRLVEHHGGNVALARADLERASTRADARDYIGAILAKRPVADDEPKSRWAI